MALVECHECGQPKSDTAKVCPHCGVKTYFLWKQNSLAVAVIAAVVTVGFILLSALGFISL
jgi:uncharacterized paraquat-inducible protein A